MCSCQERVDNVWANVTWNNFMDGDNKSDNFKAYIIKGFTRNLGALKADTACTKTSGNAVTQFLFNMTIKGQILDRSLDGPTTNVFINYWIEFLQNQGVVFYKQTELVRLIYDAATGKIKSAVLRDNSHEFVVQADYFILAIPVEQVVKFIDNSIPSNSLQKLKSGFMNGKIATSWQNGIQFYLKKDCHIVNGHFNFVDTKWALAGISQAQFWTQNLSNYGDGQVAGIISVCISDWDTPGLFGKPAKLCSTRDEVARDVWAQIKKALSKEVPKLPEFEELHSFYLDEDIILQPPNSYNNEPLLINNVHSWEFRPDAFTEINNLFLASDYVRTYTDCASMECANEAARRAVNAILLEEKRVDFCELWELYCPKIFKQFRIIDEETYKGDPKSEVKTPTHITYEKFFEQ